MLPVLEAAKHDLDAVATFITALVVFHPLLPADLRQLVAKKAEIATFEDINGFL